MPKAVIFDVDGTLVDTVKMHAKAWAETFKHYGLEVPPEAEIRQQIGKGGDQLMPVFLDERTIDQKGKDIEQYRSRLFKEDYFPKARPFPQVRELFLRIRETGISIALGSSGNADEIDGYVEMADIADLVETKTTSEDAERSKPHPDIFQAALKKLDVAASDALVVGDSPYDAEAAAKAGLRTIGFLSGGFSEAELRGAGAIAIYRDPADLLHRFDQSPLASLVDP